MDMLDLSDSDDDSAIGDQGTDDDNIYGEAIKTMLSITETNCLE